MSTCHLLDPFELYLEMSVVFGLSRCMVIANHSTLGNENFVLGFFWGGVL